MGNSHARNARRFGFAGATFGAIALAILGIANFVSVPPAPAAPAQAKEEAGVLRATLPNGLRVILVRN
ncbi:MAG TPA: hypothetical protein VHT51_02340, partial [Micropepsaceae bacterium]|nr:hypothetical protein [Micropepsaceae bacterium]